MVLCLLSRDSHGDTTKLNHEETVRGPEIAIFPEKSEILLGTALPNFTKLPPFFVLPPFLFLVLSRISKILRKGGSWKILDQRRKLGSAVPTNFGQDPEKK